MKLTANTTSILPTPPPAAKFRGDALDRILTTMFQGDKKWLAPVFAAPATPKRNPAAVESSKKAVENPVPPCPFCRLSDQLQEIGWSTEREDGSEYIGPAIRCNRCEAIAPKAAWLSLVSPGRKPEVAP